MNRIRELREDRDLRQSDIATALGIGQRTLSNYKTEKTNPDTYAIIKLCDFLIFPLTISSEDQVNIHQKFLSLKTAFYAFKKN